MNVPYQFVPSLVNVSISIWPAVGVIVGAVAPGHFTPVKVAPPRPVEAACFKNIVKLLPATAVGIVNVQVVDAVSVAVCTVPLVKDRVLAVVTVPIATTPSV